MSYSIKKPPILITLNKYNFNLLLEVLNQNDSKEEIKFLKEKLLKYSITYKDNKEELIDIRFYISEVVILLTFLIENIKVENISADYYWVVIKIKETLKSNRE